jgi:D-alanyl-D-alanine carboxypeptidase
VYQFLELRNENKLLLIQSEQINSGFEVTQKNLNKSRVENRDLLARLSVEQANNTFFRDEIQNITGTVRVLEKLSKTDTELLKKYSKVYFLNENYIPKNLSDIDPKYWYQKDKPVQVTTEIASHLQQMLDAASSEGLKLQVISAYRSFGTQAILKSSYSVTYGAGTANKFSADQGYSEHQLGTTIDFTTPTIGAKFVGFEKTAEYKWLIENSYKYGFTLSYHQNNKYYVFEPWHFRFVGLALAERLHKENVHFYDLEQRDIDQYLANLFD